MAKCSHDQGASVNQMASGAFAVRCQGCDRVATGKISHLPAWAMGYAEQWEVDNQVTSGVANSVSISDDDEQDDDCCTCPQDRTFHLPGCPRKPATASEARDDLNDPRR